MSTRNSWGLRGYFYMLVSWYLSDVSFWHHLYQSENNFQPCAKPACQRPFQEGLRWGRDPGLVSFYVKNTRLKLPLPHNCNIIVCLERPSGKKSITQEPVYEFALQINLLAPIWKKHPPKGICEYNLVWK